MKTSNWIKLIGTLCIVFGALGLINNISFFFIPQWAQNTWTEISPDRLKWMKLLEYIGGACKYNLSYGGSILLAKKTIFS